ncbi:ComEC/Rec2 family competence protein [Brevibacillus fulvus]|uniref:Competence protein ComEC n=1 Tax=Brevibacillus fulvus TaxID=1125967 RepID=A0A939BQP6_9BACL|nr:MBL fold metallo-hydrolase [Brevibacillus fulvus]MBM7588752.1 competence protein ComEC [Brevibacillus fulvus]
MRKMSIFLSLLSVLLFATAGCARESDLQDTVKIDDPYLSENERDFTGMVVTFFALPNGESTLVRFPSGKNMLIDTGSADDAEVLQTLLEERQVTAIDYLVISNDQPEHAGGFARLAQHTQLDTILLPKPIFSTIANAISLPSDKKLMLLSEGDKVSFEPKITLTVLNPGEQLSLSPQDNSLVFQLQQDQLRFLFTSAISEKTEEQLLRLMPGLLRAEVLKVADQGSNQASSQLFLNKVDPQVAIIETGKTPLEHNRGQEEVLERLGESWAETYITKQHGTITILSNGKQYRILKR